MPDPLGDDDFLTQSEALDEDDMGVDPLEGGMDPADDWAAANRYGTTANEQATDRPLTERLDEELPEITLDPPPDRPVIMTSLEELDESVDDELTPEAAAVRDGQVLVGDDLDNIGESATGRDGHLMTEPGQPAADETFYARDT
jgi:hypothetical protein